MMNFRDKKILIIVAHPDDEILGLGATMHKLINERNCLVRVIILGEGLTSRSDVRDTKKWDLDLKKHRGNILEAQNQIGYTSVGIYDFPDNRFDSISLLDIVKVIEKEKKDFNPDIIFTHHGGDLNIDHQRTFEAVMTATRPMEGERVQAVITFETPSATEWQANVDSRRFSPNLFFEVSRDDLSAKQRGMEYYEFESRTFPHPRSSRSLEILALKNGIIVGKEFVEAFCIIRLIQ